MEIHRLVAVVAAGASLLVACASANPPARATRAPRKHACLGAPERPRTDKENEQCDEFVLLQSLCLVQPDMPECELYRELELAPREKLPLDAVLGCHARAGAVLCLTKIDAFVRDRERAWSKHPIKFWQRDDTAREARWAADDGVSRLVMTRNVLVESPWRETIPPGEIVPLSPQLVAEATTAIRELAVVLSACDKRVTACWSAAENALVPPAERFDMPSVIDPPAPSRSLAGCRDEGTRVVREFGMHAPSYSKKPLALPAACSELTR